MPSKKNKKGKKGKGAGGNGNGTSNNNHSINGTNDHSTSPSNNNNISNNNSNHVTQAAVFDMSNPQDDAERHVAVNGPQGGGGGGPAATADAAPAGGTAGGTAPGRRRAISSSSNGGGASSAAAHYADNKGSRIKDTAVVVGVLLSLIVPTLWSVLYGEVRIQEERSIPETWEALKEDTLDRFQLGFSDLGLPTFYLESLRGFETIFLDDGAFYSLPYFLERSGNVELNATKWTVPLSVAHVSTRKSTPAYRNVTYLHPVSNPLAPPKAKAVRRQRTERFKRVKLLVQTWTEVMDVPMADCFVVEERMLVEQFGSKNISVSAYFRVAFTKDTMFRSVIEHQVVKETREVLHDYSEFLRLVSLGHPEAWHPTAAVAKAAEAAKAVAAAAAAKKKNTGANAAGAGADDGGPPTSPHPFLPGERKQRRLRPLQRLGSFLSRPFRSVGRQLRRATRFFFGRRL